MNREERLAFVKKLSEEKAEEWEQEHQREILERAERLAALDPEDVETRVRTVWNDEDVEVMGPDKTPWEWTQARKAIRELAIQAAGERKTITYGQAMVIAYEATGMKLGSLMTGRMCMELNHGDDGCLLSAIVVSADTGLPGSGFEPYAQSQGYSGPVATLQRLVFDHFQGNG